MTKEQIRAELRRSAMEDTHPWGGVKWDAFVVASDWDTAGGMRVHHDSNADAVRVFFLFVAEAM